MSLANPPTVAIESSLWDPERFELDRSNLFDVVRLYAALQVALMHAETHLNLGLSTSLKSFFSVRGVPVFFVLSGFLVGLSWLRNQEHPLSYARSRGARIFPALVAVGIVSWSVAGLLGETEFIVSMQGVLWLLSQITIAPFYNPEALRDFGVGVMNGSLWTIPVELQFYISLPFVLFSARKLQNRFGIAAASSFVGALLVASLLSPLLVTAPLSQGGSAPAIGTLAQKLFYVSLPPYLVQFLCGTILIVPFIYWGQRRASYVFIGLGLLVWGAQSLTGLSGPQNTLLVDLQRALLVIGIGLLPMPFNLPGDLSYGIYLWHMPIINVMIVSSALDTTTHQLAVFLAILLSFAALSWFCIESPALKKARKARDKPIPIGIPKLTS